MIPMNYRDEVRQIKSELLCFLRHPRGGGSQNLGTVLKLYVVINCEGFTKLNTKKCLYTLPQHNLTAPPTETVITIQNIGED